MTQAARESGPGWPDHYPKGCPPADAVPSSGTFFHLVSSRSPQRPPDFLTYYEKDPARYRTNCKARGLSVCADLTGVRQLQQISKALKSHHVAVLELTPIMGRMRHTPNELNSGHWTWWVAPGTNPCVAVSIIIGGDEAR